MLMLSSREGGKIPFKVYRDSDVLVTKHFDFKTEQQPNLDKLIIEAEHDNDEDTDDELLKIGKK